MRPPIHVLHVVDNLGKGGLENALVNVIEGLDANDFKHTVYAVRSLGVNAERLSGNRIEVKCLGKKDTGSPTQLAALARAIREAKPDIVHSRNWGAIEAVVAGRWAGCHALVHSEHGLDSTNPGKKIRRRLWFRRLAFEMANRVLTVSYQLRDLYARGTGFPARRITVIHNGVDGRRFHPDPDARAQAREALSLSDEFCIGCVGNLFPVKDHMTLLQAVAGFAQVRNRWRLLVIGEGPELATLQGFVDAHPEWKANVSFLGTSHRVGELLNAMDVYVLPSVSEGISNSLLEAMATGLPVVASETGGNPEVVIQGESGLLFPVGNARHLTEQLLLIEAQKEWRLQLGQKALWRVRHEFSMDAMIRNYEQLYQGLLGAATSPARATAEV